jgi:cell wall integrity and stress response component
MSTYVSTVTQPGGSVILQTVTVIPTVTASTDASTSGSSVTKDSKALSTGAAVGIAVGVFGFVAIIIAVGVWLWLRRRNRMQEAGGLDQRNSFRGSSAGMMSSTPRTEMASTWGEGESMGRRSSRLMPHDPRMDPFATNIYNRFDNKSRESVNTLRDDQDYSRRVLRTTNPDPTGAE